ncbi:MAG: IS1634 family transposase [Magnetococcales bacterium]|nr:IS1634 family transposase [Magnetococcales bacterium]
MQEGALVMFDLTSTYVEGRCCPLAKHGYSRDHRSDRLQIEFGLLTDCDGRPLVVEVFEGNTADPSALSSQVTKLRERYGFRHLIIVGDRGMITQARIDEDLVPNNLFWISALRNDAITRLSDGPLQYSLFDERNFAEISSPDYPNERLVVCRNPSLADERTRKRQELLEATEKGLHKVREAVAAGRIKECMAVGRRVERILGRFKMAKHFRYEVKDGQFTFSRDEESIAAEASLDGVYVIRTNVAKEDLDAAESVRRYKGLARVERAFRVIKAGLDVRPIYHHLADRVRAHVFLCMLAYYVEWEMRKRLAPILFLDESPIQNADPVAPAQPSDMAKAKAGRRRSHNGFQLHSFQTLLQDLGTLARNWVTQKTGDDKNINFTVLTQPTPLQQEAFRLLGVTV